MASGPVLLWCYCHFLLLKLIAIVSLCALFSVAMETTITGPVAIFVSRLPWEIRSRILQFVGPRCNLCDEGIGLLTRTADGYYELWCLRCVTSMLPDETPHVLMDGIVRGKHSYTACSPSIACLKEDEEAADSEVVLRPSDDAM